MDFIDEALETNPDQPWLAHVSYIKPHWPYIVPEPYASMFGPDDVPACNRSEEERQNAHPVFEQFMNRRVSRNFSREDVRAKVIPAYMGLIKQIDDQMGRLFQHLEDRGIADQTMIVFTSDHGDYLGDHWLGEKELFHEESVRIPLIIYDPSANADSTRGTVNTDIARLTPDSMSYQNMTIPLLSHASLWICQLVIAGCAWYLMAATSTFMPRIFGPCFTIFRKIPMS